MRVSRPFLCSVLLFLLQVSVGLDVFAQGDSLRLLWTETPTNAPWNQRGQIQGLSEDGWLLTTSSGKQVKLIETHSLSTIGSFELDRYPILAQLREKDSSIIVLGFYESGEWRDSHFDGPSVQLTPDRYGIIRIDLQTGKQTVIDTHVMVMNLCGIDPTGELIYSTSYAGQLSAWSTWTGQKLAAVSSHKGYLIHKASFILPGPYYWISGFHTHARSKFIIAAQEDSLFVHSRESFKPLFYIPTTGGIRDDVLAARLTADDRFILVREDSIVTIDLSTRKWSATPYLITGRPSLRSAHFLADDSVVVVTGDIYMKGPGATEILKLSTMKHSTITSCESSEVVMGIFPATRRLAIGDGYKVAYLYDLEARRKVAADPFPTSIRHLLLSRATSTLIARGRNIVAIDPETKEIKAVNYEHSGAAIAISPTGRFAAMGPESGNETRIIDLRTDQAVARITHGHYASSIAFSPTEQHIAVASLDRWVTVRIIDLERNKELLRSPVMEQDPRVLYNVDGSSIAVASGDTIYFYDPRNFQLERTITGNLQPIAFLHNSPDGRYLIAQEQSGITMVWEWESGILRSWHRMWAASAQMTPNNRYLIAANEKGLVAVDLRNDQAHLVIPSKGIRTFALSEDGQRIAVASSKDEISYYETPAAWYSGEAEELMKQFVALRFYLPDDAPQVPDPNGGRHRLKRTFVDLAVVNDDGEIVAHPIKAQHLNVGRNHQWNLDVTGWAPGTYRKRMNIGGTITEESFQVQ